MIIKEKNVVKEINVFVVNPFLSFFVQEKRNSGGNKNGQNRRTVYSNQDNDQRWTICRALQVISTTTVLFRYDSPFRHKAISKSHCLKYIYISFFTPATKIKMFHREPYYITIMVSIQSIKVYYKMFISIFNFRHCQYHIINIC